MTTTELTADLRILLGDVSISDELADYLIRRATDTVLNYCNRADLPARLETVIPVIAVVAYNDRGVEGESGHSEGGVSRSRWTDSLPPDIIAQLDNYRLGTVAAL